VYLLQYNYLKGERYTTLESLESSYMSLSIRVTIEVFIILIHIFAVAY